MTAIAYAPSGRPSARIPVRTGAPFRPVGPALALVPPLRTSAPARLPAGVYRRRRVVAAVVLAASLVAGATGLAMLGDGPEPISPAASRPHIVLPGDTMWSIARSLQPEGDLRPLVDRLATAHGGATLQVGERIGLPAKT